MFYPPPLEGRCGLGRLVGPGGAPRPAQRHLSGVDDDGARAVDMVPGSLLVMAVVDSLGARDEAEEGEQAALRHLRSRIELSAAAPPGQKADVPQYGIVWYDIRYRYGASTITCDGAFSSLRRDRYRCLTVAIGPSTFYRYACALLATRNYKLGLTP